MTIVRRYPLELTIAALFAVSIFVSATLSRRPALATPGVAAGSSGFTSLLMRPGAPAFTLDSIAHGRAERIVSSDRHPAVAIRAGEDVRVSGWAYDPDGKKPVTAILVQVDDANRIVAHYGAARPDVQRVFGVADAGVGFDAVIPAKVLNAGSHVFSFLVVDETGNAFYWIPRRMRVDVAR